jgi:phosphoglucosamine mutase
MVTSPRGPPEYGGVRFINPDGSSFTLNQIKDIGVQFESAVKYAKHDAVGRIKRNEPPFGEHIGFIRDVVGEIDCPVIVDCASDSTSLVTPPLLAGLGADVTTVNSNIGDGLSRRNPEPIEHNLHDLMSQVRGEPGSIGIAHNGDGSKVGVIDEGGRFVNGNALLALIASRLKADSVAVPYNASMVLDEVVKGDVIRTAAGDGNVAEVMRKNGLPFGGCSTGAMIFGDTLLCPDGIYAAAIIAQIASEGSLRQQIDEMPSYPMASAEMRINGEKEDIAKRLDEKIRSTEYEALISSEGWRVEMPDGWYFIRISGFENAVRITAEARDKMYMSGLMDIAKDIVSACIR